MLLLYILASAFVLMIIIFAALLLWCVYGGYIKSLPLHLLNKVIYSIMDKLCNVYGDHDETY